MSVKDAYVAQRCAEIESALSDAAAWSANNDRLGAQLAGYLTVFIVGVIESCVEYLIVQRAEKAGDPELRAFVEKTVDIRLRNPERGVIAGILKHFSAQYAELFTQNVPHDGPAALALGSLVTDKNCLAHQGTSKLQSTVADVHGYYCRILPILEAIEDILA